MAKKYLSLSIDKSTVTVSYNESVRGDYDFPKLTFKLYSGKPLQPPRMKYEKETTATKPSASFKLPKGHSQGYVKVVASEYGYFYNFNFKL